MERREQAKTRPLVCPNHLPQPDRIAWCQNKVIEGRQHRRRQIGHSCRSLHGSVPPSLAARQQTALPTPVARDPEGPRANPQLSQTERNYCRRPPRREPYPRNPIVAGNWGSGPRPERCIASGRRDTVVTRPQNGGGATDLQATYGYNMVAVQAAALRARRMAGWHWSMAMRDAILRCPSPPGGWARRNEQRLPLSAWHVDCRIR